MYQHFSTPTYPGVNSSSLPSTHITQTANSLKADIASSQENISAVGVLDDDDGVGGGGTSDGELWAPLAVRGYLSKWTNLLHGWQERYFILSDGRLTYYRNADDLDLGSRGSVRIKNAYVKSHEYDECRFEVRVGDVIWYLRGLNQEERYNWMSAIERHRIAESGYGSEKTIHRHSSLLSLNSTHSPSLHSASSFKRNHGLKEKLAEMETFKEILCKQVDSLQAYFDACSAIVQHRAHENLDGWLTSENCLTCSSSSSSSASYSKETIDDYDDDEDGELNEERRCRNKVYKSDKHGNKENKSSITTSDVPISLLECSSDVVPQSVTSPVDDNSTDFTASQSDSLHTPKANRRVVVDKDSNNTGSIKSGGFFSRFLPFRNFGNTSTVQTVVDSENVNKKNESTIDSNYKSKEESQYQPSSRFNDLRRILQQHGSHALDFKGEAHMFKAITAGILTNLSHSIEMMQQHEEHWRKRLEREIEKRRRSEETQKAMGQELTQLRSLIGVNANHHTNHLSHTRFSSYGSSVDFQYHSPDFIKEQIVKCTAAATTAAVNTILTPSMITDENVLRLVGPDFEEHFNSPIREEEFFDAIDAESDKMEENEVRLAALKSASEAIRWARAMPSNHPLYNELDKVVKMHVKNFANTQIFNYSSKLCTLSSDSVASLSTRYTATNNIDSEVSGNTELVGQNINETPENWRIVVQDGDMIIFRRELETDDGVVLDPLQAIHVVDGVTAKEMCTYFWDVRYRMDWEFTVDRAPTVLEVCGDDTVVIHQMYKRVWPTAQRDSLFWSHICPINPVHPKDPSRKSNHNPSMSISDHPVPNNYHVNHNKVIVHQRSASMGICMESPSKLTSTQFHNLCEESVIPENSTGKKVIDSNILDAWMVINMSTDYLSHKIEPSPAPTVRLGLEVVLYCRTEILTNDSCLKIPDDLTKLTRNQIRTRLIYMANINPGGWVPAAGLRSLAQREYPRFLKRFSTYVKDQTQHKTPLF
ncbi:unnamed protein product [Heterobilharzia americana]|nr:unnamed protein product [Heterobilharzia americana]